MTLTLFHLGLAVGLIVGIIIGASSLAYYADYLIDKIDAVQKEEE